MRKIEIISDPNCKKVQQAVNEFVKDKIITDLQFSSTTDDYSVMVVYMEKKELVAFSKQMDEYFNNKSHFVFGENEFNSPRKELENYNELKNKYLNLSKNQKNSP